MARLYLFAIGGTGARVLKSLTFLLAAGVKPGGRNTYEIVPVIIDPHKSNEDLKRTERLLEDYEAITKAAGVDNGFFGTRITTLKNLVSTDGRLTGSSFTCNLQQVAGKKFREYIDFSSLEPPTRALADILFSGKTINKRHDEVDLLDIEMDIGFVGNPNIGSVVLNQFKDSEEFKEIASNFNADDRIFIISSIFGGTGAAGFPIILKNIRDAMSNAAIDGKGFLQNAKIGALTVLPYFNVEKDADSPIQKSDFIAKTKAALYYYKDNVTGNQSVNTMYYIADTFSGKPYKNDPGDNGQKNSAHFIELASALAIIDFLKIPDAELETVEGSARRPVYKEFSILNDAAEITFGDFEDYTSQLIGFPLSQFALFRKYVNEQLDQSVEKEPWSLDKPLVDRQFLDDSFFRTHLSGFLSSWDDWLKEMAENRRAFAPFNTGAGLDVLVKGKTVKTGWFTPKVNYPYYNGCLNKMAKGQKYPDAEQKLLRLFFNTTAQMLTSRFGFK